MYHDDIRTGVHLGWPHYQDGIDVMSSYSWATTWAEGILKHHRKKIQFSFIKLTEYQKGPGLCFTNWNKSGLSKQSETRSKSGAFNERFDSIAKHWWTACSWLLCHLSLKQTGAVFNIFEKMLFAAPSVSAKWLGFTYNTHNHCIFLKSFFKCLNTDNAREKYFCWHKTPFCYKKKAITSFVIKLCPRG